jgi:hypothetical protein
MKRTSLSDSRSLSRAHPMSTDVTTMPSTYPSIANASLYPARMS